MKKYIIKPISANRNEKKIFLLLPSFWRSKFQAVLPCTGGILRLDEHYKLTIASCSPSDLRQFNFLALLTRPYPQIVPICLCPRRLVSGL